MIVSDFFNENDVLEAPDNGPDAFAYLVERAERKLKEFYREVPDDNDSWREISTAQYSFMNVVAALAKSYEIDAFVPSIPTKKTFVSEHYEQFRHDLDHYVTQLIVLKIRREKNDSIIVYPTVKESIRTHLHHIRNHIDKIDIPAAKRAALHRKLAEFETALEKTHVNVLAVARFVMEIMSLSANGLEIADSAALHRLCGAVLKTVAAEKAHQAETRAVEAPPVKLIEASAVVRRPLPRQSAMAQDRFDLDDEIPF